MYLGGNTEQREWTCNLSLTSHRNAAVNGRTYSNGVSNISTICSPYLQATILNTVHEWLEDASKKSDETVLLAAAIILAREGNDIEALKACHAGKSLEL